MDRGALFALTLTGQIQSRGASAAILPGRLSARISRKFTINFALVSSSQKWCSRSLARIAAGCLLLVFPAFILRTPGQAPEPTDTVRIDTNLVNVNVSVFNRNSAQTVGALEQKDFTIFEN